MHPLPRQAVLTIFATVALCGPAALRTAWSATPTGPAAPTLHAQARNPNTVQVRGQHLPPGRWRVYADADMPHASVACNAEFERQVQVGANGRLALTLHTNPKSGCSFACGREPEPFVLVVEKPDGHMLAQTKFMCAPRHKLPGL